MKTWRALLGSVLLLVVASVQAAVVDVHVKSFDFTNGSVHFDPTINVGDTIHWIFDGSFHSTTSSAGQAESWDSGVQTTIGVSYNHTFTHAGTYNYYCSIHGFDAGGGNAEGMHGHITVNSGAVTPTLTSISPSSVQAGSGAFTMTLTGANFTAQSVAKVDGSARSTTFGSATSLTAAILASDVAVSGTHNITVETTGAGTSGAKVLTVTTGAPQNVSPTSFSIVEGTLFSGGLNQLLASDNAYVSAFQDDTSLICTYQIDSVGPATGSSPSLELDYEGKSSRVGLTVEVRLKNYQTSDYDVVDSREATLSDDTMNPSVSPANAYIGSGQTISAQISFYPFNDEAPAQDGWLQYVDLIRWRIGA